MTSAAGPPPPPPPGAANQVVRARAPLALGTGAVMEVQIGGVLVATAEVNATASEDDGFAVPPIAPGTPVDLSFSNDDGAPGGHQRLLRRRRRVPARGLLSAARARAGAAERKAAAARAELARALETLAGLLGEDRAMLREAAIACRDAVAGPGEPRLLDAMALTTPLTGRTATLAAAIAAIEERLGATRASAAEDRLDRLLELAAQRCAAEPLAAELERLQAALTTVTALIGRAAAREVGARLDRLRRPMNEIDAAIQGEKARPLRLDPPPAGAQEIRRLDLLVAFVAGAAAV